MDYTKIQKTLVDDLDIYSNQQHFFIGIRAGENVSAIALTPHETRALSEALLAELHKWQKEYGLIPKAQG